MLTLQSCLQLFSCIPQTQEASSTMRFTVLAALVAPLFAVGSALAAPSPAPIPVQLQKRSVAAAVPAESKAPSPDLVYPSYDALIYCSGLSCSGTCYYVDLDAGFDEGVCYISDIYYQSIIAYSPHDTTWDFLVYAGYDDCEDSVQIPNLNTCYNLEINGAYAEYNSYFFEP